MYLYPLSISFWRLGLFLIDQTKFFVYSKSALSKRYRMGVMNGHHIKCSNGPINKSNPPNGVFYYLTQNTQNISISTAISVTGGEIPYVLSFLLSILPSNFSFWYNKIINKINAFCYGNVFLWNPAWVGEMDQGVKALAMKTRRPEFDPQNPHTGGRRELTPQCCPNCHICAMSLMYPPTHTHVCMRKNNNFFQHKNEKSLPGKHGAIFLEF